jgi:threonine/homoserine/homoserine lactone efflux protein
LCITIAAAYTLPEAFATSLTAAALIFAIVNLPCGIVWTSFGVTLRRFLSDPRRVRIFNVSMALALVASLWPLITDLLKLTIGN